MTSLTRTRAATLRSVEAERKTTAQLALEAIGYAITFRAVPEGDAHDEEYRKADNAALEARDTFLARMLADTGMTRPLLDALMREGVL